MTLQRTAPVLAGLLFLLAWQLYVQAALPDFVARPSGIVAAIPATLADPDYWQSLWLTILSIVEGVALGSALGVVVGVAMGRIPALGWFLSVYIRALYSLPLIALVPLIILLVGYRPSARLIVVAISAFLPVAVTTADGTRAIPNEYLEVGRMFGARTRHVWLGIALPSALPHVVTGIELGFARGITNAIAVEVLASIPGMGTALFERSAELNEDASFVFVVTLALFAVGVRLLMIRARRRLAPWYAG